jgi:hypothetical protein
MPWNPTTIRRPDKAFKTATDTVRVTTDAGHGYLKALGNHGSPHFLAADLVGTQLAAWLGLPTFEWAILDVSSQDEIKFVGGGQAQPGPAFITREVSGTTWGGTEAELNALVNPNDIGKLVLFDTWTRNCDRHPPDLTTRKVNRNNVFLSNEGLADGLWRLMAMDHTHCFNCGRDLNAHLGDIDLIQDDHLFGLFPEFKSFILRHQNGVSDGLAKLKTLDRAWLESVVTGIPVAWQVEESGRRALVSLLLNRAQYVSGTFATTLNEQIRPPDSIL